MPAPQVPANDPERPERQAATARRRSNALLMLADGEPGPIANRHDAGRHDPAAKPLLMMARTMRDAAGDDRDREARRSGQ